jgi:demethylmenaquinone methyltransferase/2-methoxy-6-polyprenyl-1,4-benzoquinol methylase
MKTAGHVRLTTDEEASYYSLNKRVYAIFARFYDAVAFPLRRLRHQVASMVPLRPGSRVLDVATGTGGQAFAFADKALEVVGIDLSGAMLRIARGKNRFPNVTFLEADATALPFEDASFDATCVSFALHEMPSSIRERVIREMARVTRPSGTFIVVDYALPPGRVASALAFHIVKLYEPDHYSTFVKSDLPALLESAGIDVLDQRPLLLGLAKVTVGHRHGIRRSRE